jgi:asparagine synthase (glutamine-hydrolysing)
MCGIAGFSGRFDGELLAAMGDALDHRGPDGRGQVHEPEAGIGLAHRRLAILDLSPAGAQPMWDAERRACIVFNGEIYNFLALRRELEADGHRFRGHSDTEVLVELYVRDGEAMLARLDGIFALGLWDAVRGVLLLARDGLGVKPLYWAQTRDGVLFASEIKSLLCHPGLDRALEPRALVSHLSLLWAPAPMTVLAAVHKLEPGAALAVSDGRVTRHWFHYRLPVRTEIPAWDDREAAASVRQTLMGAVEAQLVSDVPVGSFLSGGLDSSAVVACARAARPGGDLPCFTIALEDRLARREGIVNDLPFAELAARHLGVALHRVSVGPEMADDVPRMLWHLDEPMADPAPLNVLYIARLARARGIKVLLSGAGGDDLFSGYRRHRARALERYWAWLPRPLRGVLAAGARGLPGRPAPLRKLARALRDWDLEPDARLSGYFQWLPWARLAPLLAPDLRARVCAPVELERSLDELPRGTADLDRMLYLECRHFLADHNLAYTDKMSMAAGVEVRVPLLDRHLVDLAFALPARLKQRGAEGKWVLKRAMEPLLPRELIYRPKTGFGVPLRAWLRGPLAELLGDILSPASIARRGLLDAGAVQRLVSLDRAGRLDAAYPIFALLCLELWCRIFLDGEVPR